MRPSKALLGLLLALTASCATSHQPSRLRTEAIDSVAGRALAENPPVGAVVAVAWRGELVFQRGYGLRDMATRQPMTAEAVLDYFSIGKHMTAAILLRAAERGLLDLDAPAARYLPDGDFEGAAVTTRQLLSHSSGLWEAEPDENDLPERFRSPPPAGAIIALAGEGERLAAPGETWLYSGGGFLFAGEIARAVTGREYDELIGSELSGPLGLGIDSCQALRGVRAPAYFLGDGRTHLIPDVDTRWFAGAGSACGTAGDLVRWWLALRTDRVLDPVSRAQMFMRVALVRNGAQASFGYGLGVRMGRFAGHAKVGHTGSGGGGTSVLAEYPEEGLVIAVVTNTGGEGALDARHVEAAVATALLGADLQAGTTEPVSIDFLTALTGLYRSPVAAFCITASRGDLWRSINDEAPTRLLHVGDGRFRSADDELGVGTEYFLGTDSGRAQWFAYDAYGLPEDLAVREADSCP